MDQLARRLGLKTDPVIFSVSAGFMVVFVLALGLFPAPINAAFAAGRTWVVTNLGWFFILGVNLWLVFLLWIAMSSYGRIRLGDPDERPAYSTASWFTMLFAGGIGTVLMFWGVAEPISHFSAPPLPGVEPFTPDAARDAITIAIYHLGLHTWTIFALPGLCMAYFIYRHDLPVRVSSVFWPILGTGIYGPIGRTIDIFAILGTLFGVSVSLGLGSSQIAAGLGELFSIEASTWLRIVILAVLMGVALVSILVGLDNGVRILSNVNIGLAVGLMIFVLLTGSTLYLLRATVETFGLYLSGLPRLMFWNDLMTGYIPGGDEWGWQGNWTVFYWAWTVTWSPFIGLFVARISRGRTIREFVMGVLFAPSLFTLVWFAIFGWSAMGIDGIGEEMRQRMGDEAGALSRAVEESIPLAMFAFFENFPLTTIVQGLAVIIVAIFFATSADSASIVMDMLCSGAADQGPVGQRVFWGVSTGAVAGILIFMGGSEALTALQQVITVVGLPIFLLVCGMVASLALGLKAEDIDRPDIADPDRPEPL